jgi:NifU-like protein involved in Fe-S cluster formation
MASTDAKPVPQKNVAYRVTFPIMDADGDLVTGATGLDSEVSKDGATFADCTSEATEIATASGMYYLDLTSTEMNADTVAIIVKTSSVGAKTTSIVMYPEEAGDIRVNVTQVSGDTTAADTLELFVEALDQSTGQIDAGTFAADAIAAATLAADVTTELQSGLATAAALATVDTVVDAILVDTGTDIPATLATVAGYLDTEIAAILEDTGATLPAQIAALNNLSAAQVNAEVLDVLATDTFAEPGAGAPAATASLKDKIGYVYKAWRNKVTQTSSTYTLYGDDAITAHHTAAVGDDGATFTKNEVGA